MLKKITLFLLLMLFAATASARPPRLGLGYTLTRSSASGGLILSITTDTPGIGSWLGISLHQPQNGTNANQGKDIIFPIKKGKWIKEIAIGPEFNNGSFEIAIWGHKILKDKCADTDEFCQQNGFRLDGKYAYGWGLLNLP